MPLSNQDPKHCVPSSRHKAETSEDHWSPGDCWKPRTQWCSAKPSSDPSKNQLLCRKQRRGEMGNYKGSTTQWPSRASSDWLSTPATPRPKHTMASRTPKLHGKTKKQRSHMKSVPRPYSIPNIQLAKCCTSHPSDPHLYTSCDIPPPRKAVSYGICHQAAVQEDALYNALLRTFPSGGLCKTRQAQFPSGGQASQVWK